MSTSSHHRLRRAFVEKKAALGLYSRSASPTLIEFMGYLGLDYAVVDLEHTSIDLGMVEHLIRAAALADLSILVRVPVGDRGIVSRVLDIGANGVVFPHVNSKQDALDAVALAKYAPLGKRGWAP